MAFNLRKPPKLSAKLDAYPYQLDAVRAVQKLPYAAIFHEQGLGKTKIAVDLALSWLESDAVDTVFIITKKTLVQNWVDELSTHSYVSPRVLSGNRRKNNIALNSPVMLYVMNYEVILANFDLLQLFLKTCRVGAILDESQKIKNPEAKLTESFHALASGFCRRVIMTGTPVANRPFDIWSQIKFLDDGEALGESFAEFKAKTEIPDSASERDEYGGRLAEIMGKLKDFSVRETKKSSGIELPDKTIITQSVEMAPLQAEIYADYRDKLSHEFVSADGVVTADSAEDILKRLLRLVQCASNPALVDDSYQETPGKFAMLAKILDQLGIDSAKVIIWTGFIENVEWLCRKLHMHNPAKTHGGLAIDSRNRNIAKFNKDKFCRILVATPGAAKEGLTLTVANHAVFYDRGFSLDDYLQAQDRIHRISQKQNCFVHNLVARDTIDQWIDRLLYAKHQAAQLTQGDIDQSAFSQGFDFDLSHELSEILNATQLNPSTEKI